MSALDSIPLNVLAVAALGTAASVAYPHAVRLMTNQQTWYLAVTGKVSANFIILFAIVTFWVDARTRKMTKWKGRILWIAYLIAIAAIWYIIRVTDTPLF